MIAREIAIASTSRFWSINAPLGGLAPEPDPSRLHAKDCSAILAAPRARHRALHHVAAGRQSRSRYNSAKIGNGRRSLAGSSIGRREQWRSPPERFPPPTGHDNRDRRRSDAGFADRPAQIITQSEEIPAPGARSADQHEIEPGQRNRGEFQPSGFTQPPPGSISDHRVTDLLRDGEADAGLAIVNGARQNLKDQPMRRGLAALSPPHAKIRRGA